jgi:hypothetical protein
MVRQPWRHIGAGTAIATIAAWTVERPVRRGIRRHLFRAGTTVRLIHRTMAHTAARRRAVIVVAFKGFQQLENKAVVVAQKRPAAVLGILLAQGIAEHGQPLFIAALDIVDKKPRSKLMRTAQCMLISSTMQVARIAINSLPVMPGRQNFKTHSFTATNHGIGRGVIRYAGKNQRRQRDNHRHA